MEPLRFVVMFTGDQHGYLLFTFDADVPPTGEHIQACMPPGTMNNLGGLTGGSSSIHGWSELWEKRISLVHRRH